MSTSLAEAHAGLSSVDFDEIEKAVMETQRGRWFLGEYARRLRGAEKDKLLSAISKLESAIAANQDELLQRLGNALSGTGQPLPTAAPAPELSPRQMRYFRDDEDLFEPAAASKTRLVVHNEPEPADSTAMPEFPPIQRMEPPAAPPSASDQPAKRRIVIIRHQPGEAIDVPLQTEMAEAG